MELWGLSFCFLDGLKFTIYEVDNGLWYAFDIFMDLSFFGMEIIL